MKARYGQRGDKEQRRVEGLVIKQIADHVARGYRLSFLVDALNRTTWRPAPQGKKWTRTTVERIIAANPRRMRVTALRLAVLVKPSPEQGAG